MHHLGGQQRKGFLNSPLLIALCSLLTLGLTLSNAWVLFSFHSSTSQQAGYTPYGGGSLNDQPVLRRPSQFIGLSSLNFSSYPSSQHPPHKLITFASLLLPLHRPQPGSGTKEKPELKIDSRAHFTRFGTISPEDRPLFVSNPDNYSTIVQFRSRDFGLELCRLRLELPKDRVWHPKGHSQTDKRDADHPHKPNDPRQRNWHVEGDLNAIEVWYLTSTPSQNTKNPTLFPSFLDPFTLTDASLPTTYRHSRLASLSIDDANETSTSTPWFGCPADTIQSFEIFCTSPNCVLDVWQDKAKPIVGIAMEQKETFM
jgi:hypothetical protein